LLTYSKTKQEEHAEIAKVIRKQANQEKSSCWYPYFLKPRRE